MSHSPNNPIKESSETEHQSQASSETKTNTSEIERLYLKIKEDWL